jgi:peptidoglycan hydrolase CwlO-like protein
VRARGPSTRRPAFLVVLAGLVAGLAVVAGVARADDPGSLRSQADTLRAENAQLSDAAARALLDLYALESRLRQAERRTESLRARIGEVEARQASTRHQLQLAKEAEAKAQEALADRIRAIYTEGDTDPLEVILGASSLDGIIDAIDSVNRVADHDRRIIDQVKQTRGELRDALNELARQQHELTTLMAEAESARATLTRATDERAAYVASLEQQRALNADEIASLLGRAADAETRATEITASAPASAEPSQPAEPSEPAPVASPSEADVSPEPGRQVTVSATKYCLTGTTATGMPVQVGVIATDPSYIALGTRMYVPGYGEGVAADTGGAVVGWTIDLWVPSCAEADAYGRQSLTITIYDD